MSSPVLSNPQGGYRKPQADVYTVLLALAAVALILGMVCLYFEMQRFNFDLKPPAPEASLGSVGIGPASWSLPPWSVCWTWPHNPNRGKRGPVIPRTGGSAVPPELLAGVRTPRCPGEPSAPAETASVAANPAARSQRSARELLRVHPAYAARLQEVGLDSATALIELPGEIVCGHPDRHVRRVVRPDLGGTFYLKRQHRVGWRERWRNWRLGFGWVSRSVREGQLLEQLQACGLAVPQWVAYGEDGRGRAFLLVEELPETCDLLQLLRGAGPASAVALHGPQRLRLARDLGEMLYRYHQAGFVTPNVQAKHLLYQPRTRQWFLIDWASAARKGRVTVAERAAALATLHASVPAGGCGLRDRLRVLRAALGMARGPQSSLARQQWRRWLVRVQRLAKRLVGRRSVREQRQGLADGLRWVWLAARCSSSRRAGRSS